MDRNLIRLSRKKGKIKKDNPLRSHRKELRIGRQSVHRVSRSSPLKPKVEAEHRKVVMERRQKDKGKISNPPLPIGRRSVRKVSSRSRLSLKAAAGRRKAEPERKRRAKARDSPLRSHRKELRIGRRSARRVSRSRLSLRAETGRRRAVPERKRRAKARDNPLRSLLLPIGRPLVRKVSPSRLSNLKEKDSKIVKPMSLPPSRITLSGLL